MYYGSTDPSQNVDVTLQLAVVHIPGVGVFNELAPPGYLETVWRTE
jgi:hypothetical protein